MANPIAPENLINAVIRVLESLPDGVVSEEHQLTDRIYSKTSKPLNGTCGTLASHTFMMMAATMAFLPSARISKVKAIAPRQHLNWRGVLVPFQSRK